MPARAKNVFLTGASSGIGAAIAQALCAAGHRVWGSSRDLNKLPPLASFRPVALDLLDPNSVNRAFAETLRESGGLDVMINNAGSGHFGPAEELSAETIQDQFQVLVFSHIQLMQLALAAMRERDHGVIINVTSLAARLPVPFMAAYNAAKAAMAAFTMSAQLELGDTRVRIVDLQPADISTAFNRAVIKSDPADPRSAARLAQTWEIIERNMAAAPGPELVARHVLRLIEQTNPPALLTVGDLFQSKIAPFLLRFLPQRVRLWGLKKYYKL